jgi:hypothetical protein
MSYATILDRIDGINLPTPKLRRQFACNGSFDNIYDLQCRSNADYKLIINNIKNNKLVKNNTPSSFIKKQAFKSGYYGTPNLSYADWREEIIQSTQNISIAKCTLCYYLSQYKSDKCIN